MSIRAFLLLFILSSLFYFSRHWAAVFISFFIFKISMFFIKSEDNLKNTRHSVDLTRTQRNWMPVIPGFDWLSILVGPVWVAEPSQKPGCAFRDHPNQWIFSKHFEGSLAEKKSASVLVAGHLCQHGSLFVLTSNALSDLGAFLHSLWVPSPDYPHTSALPKAIVQDQCAHDHRVHHVSWNVKMTEHWWSTIYSRSMRGHLQLGTMDEAAYTCLLVGPALSERTKPIENLLIQATFKLSAE